ncbi:glutaminase A [Aldersonia sp. NBC_00410]|uniref:glutaminase A n=1 Tax=Aldersonia sp. NBC_00410 TaxID=2975954 RepID=UPI002253C82B|nr:glutaminase A [Aldersonia sp. NBC_00410]MCX5042551.1 glutaminase A [Aldersonia sp. NBC_00410]
MRNVVEQLVEEVFDHCRNNQDGAPADYIPELAAVDLDSFALCLATSDGHLYAHGDADRPFTIQSVSKPFTYALALSEHGMDAVAERIDVEPSGEPFNEISLDPVSGRPRNPMINAGAITAAALIPGSDVAERFEHLRSYYSRFAGRELSLNEAVYTSEARTGHRNRAIGHMLRSFDIVDGDPDEAVDLYFRQCSIDVTCRDLAMMAATLANNGRQPLTDDKVLDPELTRRVLSVMTTCGMYDAAGDWVTAVGMPAKSGVSGCVLAVLPGQVGVAVFSPRLDQHGNSVRGVAACRELSRRLELHFLRVTREARSTIRSSHGVDAVPSRQRRAPEERAVLDRHGSRARVYELHGDLLFAGTEIAVREITAQSDNLDALVLDVRRVDDVSAVAHRLLARMRLALAEQGCESALIDPERRGTPAHDERVFDDLDAATQWCEDLLLERHGGGVRIPTKIDLPAHPLLRGLGQTDQDHLIGEFAIREYGMDEIVVQRGSPRSGLFLVLAGQVSTTLPGIDGATHRVTTLGAGMSFGEIPMLVGGEILADTRADTPTRLAVLSPDRFDRLTAAAPQLKLLLLERLAATAYGQLDSVFRIVAGQGDLG